MDNDALQQQLDQLAEATKVAFDRIEGNMATREELAEVRTLAARSLRIQESILSIVSETDDRLKIIRDHSDRLERLERTVYAPPAKR